MKKFKQIIGSYMFFAGILMLGFLFNSENLITFGTSMIISASLVYGVVLVFMD